MDKTYEQLDAYMFEILAELNAPCTKDMLIGYMEDGEKVNEAYQEMLERVEKYFVDEYDVKPMHEIEKPMQNTKTLNIPIKVQVIKDEDCYIVKAPKLKIAVQGKTKEQATKRFIEVIIIYLEEQVNES